MQTEQLVSVNNFCLWHNVELSFVETLHNYGLIAITSTDSTAFIPESQLAQVEKLVRLHNEFHINPEGVEVIAYLLEKIETKEQKIRELQNRLQFYED